MKSGRQVFLEGERERNENERRGRETIDRQMGVRKKKVWKVTGSR